MSEWIAFTGSSKGIGFQLSKIYKDNGYKILNIGRSFSSIQDEFIFWDLSKEPNHQTFDELSLFFSKKQPTQLLNCAGVLGPSEEDYFKLDNKVYWEKYREAFSVNFLSTVRLCKLYMSSLDRTDMKKKPVIMHLSSGAATHPERYFGLDAYALSKSALLNWFINQASFHKDSFHLLSIAPGVIRTGMVEDILKLKKEHFEAYDKFKEIKEKQRFIPIEKASLSLFNVLNSEDYLEKFHGKFLDLRKTSLYS